MPGPILAVHAAQNLVAAGLQGNVRVLGDARRRCHQPDQLVGPVHGLDRADAQLLQRSAVEDRAHQILKFILFGEISSPPAEVDARDDHLFVTGRDQLVHFPNRFVQLQRAAVPSRERDDAKRTAVIAAVLHFEVGASLFGVSSRFEDRRCQQFGVCEDVTDEDGIRGGG